MVNLKKSYNKKKISRNKVKTFKKKKTKKFIEQRNKSQKGLGQESSFLDRLLGPNEMVFMGDPQCNLKDCCFSQQKEQDEESVIEGLQDQNKYLKEELKEIKRKLQKQNKTLDKLGQANLDATEKLKEYLIEQNIIKVIGEKKNLWNWADQYLEYIEIKNDTLQSDKKRGIQNAGAVLEESSDSSIKQPEEQPKESKHELILVEEFKNLNLDLMKLNSLYEENKLKSALNKISDQEIKLREVNKNIKNIKKQITNIGLFIDKHLNKISIRFYNKNKYSQEQKIYIELREYLEESNIIQIQENKWKWSEGFNKIIQTVSEVINEKTLIYDKVNEFSKLFKQLTLGKSQELQYSNKLINSIEAKLQEMINISTSVSDADVKKRIFILLEKDIKQLGKQINKDLQQININYHNGTKFNSPNP